MNTELKILAKKFSNYRGNRSKTKYPECLWKEAHALSLTHSNSEIAEALGVSALYLEKKIRSFPPTIDFAQVEVDPPSLNGQYQLEFAASNGSMMRLEFIGNTSEVGGLIKLLAGIK